MAEILIYTRNWCGYCARARRLLDAKGVAYEEVDLDLDPARETEMLERSGGRFTVPQIFINGRHIGGSDELLFLESEGRLDGLLAASS